MVRSSKYSPKLADRAHSHKAHSHKQGGQQQSTFPKLVADLALAPRQRQMVTQESPDKRKHCRDDGGTVPAGARAEVPSEAPSEVPSNGQFFLDSLL